jgi:hypothetical protein
LYYEHTFLIHAGNEHEPDISVLLVVLEQTVDNQLLALAQRGYTVPPARAITETISGGVCAMEGQDSKTSYRISWKQAIRW